MKHVKTRRHCMRQEAESPQYQRLDEFEAHSVRTVIQARDKDINHVAFRG